MSWFLIHPAHAWVAHLCLPGPRRSGFRNRARARGRRPFQCRRADWSLSLMIGCMMHSHARSGLTWRPVKRRSRDTLTHACHREFATATCLLFRWFQQVQAGVAAELHHHPL